MRDYNPIKGMYALPNNLWRQTISMIRDYYRLKAEYDDRIDEGMSPGSETPGGKTNKTGDPTGMKAIKLSSIAERIRAVEKAKLVVPYEYMDGIWNHIIYRRFFPGDADRSTYTRWQQRFVFEVARNMHWV